MLRGHQAPAQHRMETADFGTWPFRIKLQDTDFHEPDDRSAMEKLRFSALRIKLQDNNFQVPCELAAIARNRQKRFGMGQHLCSRISDILLLIRDSVPSKQAFSDVPCSSTPDKGLK